MSAKEQSEKKLYSHLKLGLYSGLSVGFILAYIESIYLLFKVGSFLVDLDFFIKAVLIYGMAGALAGLFLSLLFYIIFLKKVNWSKNNIFAFYFSFFLGTGIFAEIFVYLTDIIPFGGANKWSFKTLILLAIGAIFSGLLIIITNRLFRKILSGQWIDRVSQKMRFPGTIMILILIIVSFLTFMLFKHSQHSREKKEFKAKQTIAVQKTPNVIIILVDALRPDHLSCYGYSLPTSPNIDKLADQGVLFNSVLATSNWSIPTHASLFTGTYPSCHGAYSLFSILGEDIPTLSEILTKKGYYTINLYNNPLLGKSGGLGRGFELGLGIENEHKVSLTLIRLYEKIFTEDSLTDDIFHMSQKLINQAHEYRVPYFLFLNLLDVHGPYRPKEPYFSQFLKSVKIDQVDVPLVNKFRYHIKSKVKQFKLLLKLKESDFAYLFRMYDSNIRFVDEEIGKFIKSLRNKGQLDNTLILVTADHGEYLGEHGIIGHVIQKMYNPALKIPLVFWFPEKLKPEIRSEYISQVDIFPSILGLLKLENQIPKQIQGINLFSEKRSTDIIAEFWDDNLNRFSRTIIFQELKLIINSNGKIELFNLKEDPYENNNLANIIPQKVEEFTLKLNQVIRSFKSHESKISKKMRKKHLNILKGLGYIDH